MPRLDGRLHISRHCSKEFLEEKLCKLFPGLQHQMRQEALSVPSPLCFRLDALASVPFWLTTSVAQDGVAGSIRPPQHVDFKRDLLRTPDGGTVAVDVAEFGIDMDGADAQQDIATVVVFPGLTSNSDSAYIQRLAYRIRTRFELMHEPVRICVFIYRGCGGLAFTSPKSYCAADTSDMELGIVHVFDRYPSTRSCAIGCSLGGVLLSRYLSYGRCRFSHGCAIVSAPYDLLSSSENLLRFPYRQLHSRVLSAGLRRLAVSNREMLSANDVVDLERAINCSSVAEFDEVVTRRIFGFASVDDYYRDASPKRFLSSIVLPKPACPLLLVHAFDDPVAPGKDLPLEIIAAHEGADVALLETNCGGHLSFLTGGFLRMDPFSYADELVSHFVSLCLVPPPLSASEPGVD